MAIKRYEDAPHHRAIEFQCDEVDCGEFLQTGYSMFEYALNCAKDSGWYVLPENPQRQGPKGGDQWLHLCPAHGKAEWIKRKEMEKSNAR